MRIFKRIAIINVTKEGKLIALRLKKGFSKSRAFCFDGSKGRLKNITAGVFDKQRFDGIIFVMALGIVVRLIAPFLKSKHNDPAVVVIDDFARYAISAVCGHEGGANILAIQAGNILDAEPVITTASEALKDITIGIGCRKGIGKKQILSAIRQTAAKAKVSLKRVRYISTIDLKAGEKGLVEASEALGIPLRIIPRARIRHYKGAYTKSAFVYKKIGVGGVSQPCALMAGIRTRLIMPKARLNGITIAIAKEG